MATVFFAVFLNISNSIWHKKLVWCIFLQQREWDAAHNSPSSCYVSSNKSCAPSSSYGLQKISSFIIWSLQNKQLFSHQQNDNEIKSKISAKYNRLIIHIQLVKCQHFYPPPPKKYFSQQEDTGVRWAALTQKKEKPTLQFPESLNSFPSCLIQVFGEFTNSEYEQVPFVSVTASSPHLVRLSYLIFVPGSNRKGCFFFIHWRFPAHLSSTTLFLHIS